MSLTGSQAASGKDRIQNYCEQNYPASARQDREDHVASPRHWAFPQAPRIGRGRGLGSGSGPLIVRRDGG